MPRCSQVKCRITETGVCLEGHEQGCPHLLPNESAIDFSPPQVGSPASDVAVATEPRRFHTGEKLTVSEASRLLNERPARVVLCVGARESGKTTFLARLGEMFRDGSFSRYYFAGSLTLCAFERASWLATIASGVGRPDTTRTRHLENDTFLHLRVHPAQDLNCKLDLLISDLAGETFPRAVATREFCADLCALVRADHLLVFLDCARIVDTAQRHPECDNASTFLQRVSTVKNQPQALRVQVVFSRWDYIIHHPQRIVHEEFCKATEASFTERFAGSFAALDFRRITARPDHGIQPTNAEIQSLFALWLETPLHPPTPPTIRNHHPVRDFSAFGLS